MRKIGSLILCLCMMALSICSPFSSFVMPVQAETVDTTLVTETVSFESVDNTEEDDEVNYTGSMEFLDTFIDDSQMMAPPDEGAGQATTYSLNQNLFTDSTQSIALDGLTTSAPDFTPIIPYAELKAAGNYGSNTYLGLQGGCFDGEYYYYAFIVKSTATNNPPVDACIISGTMNYSGEFTLVSIMTGLMNPLRHVNDMTYNKDTQEIAIACCEEGYHNYVYTISAANLRNGVKNFTPHEVSCMVTAIDYNATRSRYVVSLSRQKYAFAILDSDFQLLETIGYQNEENSEDETIRKWATQGIYADNLYIYCLYYFNESTTTNDYRNDPESLLRIFDWDGKYVKTFAFNLNKSQTEEYRIYECENIFIAKDRLLISFACIPKQDGKQSRSFTYVDMSDYTFHMQFCPDENISAYIHKYDNGNVNAVMLYGLSTPLRKFRVSQTGKSFVGWTAYRVEANMWYYKGLLGLNEGWYREGEQPLGYSKYVYEDKQSVARTGNPGEHVLMCAQWEDTSKFTVSFLSSDGNGTMDDQKVTYGNSTALRANTFTKNERDFYAWNAYWSEKNCWYYVSPDGATKVWRKEGQEPDGYKKYEYTDTQNVAKTVYAGGHVYMYAVWNEYHIQYDAGGATIEYGNILEEESGKYATGAHNDVQVYERSKVYVDNPTTGTRDWIEKDVVKYQLYRREIGKWLYIHNDGTKKWFVRDQETAGYTIYERTADANIYLGATALPGEHLVLKAMWQ